MLQFDVSKRIDAFSLSLIVHNKISEIRAIETNNEMSRIINENSRLSMSSKVPQRPPPGNHPPNLPHFSQAPQIIQQQPLSMPPQGHVLSNPLPPPTYNQP